MARKTIRQGLIGDVLRRVPLGNVSELRIPKDIRRVLVDNIESLRENAVDIFAKEISKVLAKIDVHNIVDDVLKNYSLRLEARIDLVPKKNGTPREGQPRKGKK
jgi:hypothetical protein